jgi:hypothetical protein
MCFVLEYYNVQPGTYKVQPKLKTHNPKHIPKFRDTKLKTQTGFQNGILRATKLCRMQPIAWIRSNLKALFYGSLLANIIVIGVMGIYKEALIQPISPKGIVTLELTRNDSTMRAIVESWAAAPVVETGPDICAQNDGPRTALAVAERLERWDYLFIITYSASFAILVLALAGHYRLRLRRWLGPLLVLVALAAVCDVIENLFTQAAFHTPQTSHALPIFIPAVLKFTCLAITAIALILLTIKLGYLLYYTRRICLFILRACSLLWRFRIVSLVLLLLFFVSYVSDQGQDMLLVVNGADRGVITLLTVLTLMALLNWLLPKFYGEIRREQITWANLFGSKLTHRANGIKAGLTIRRRLDTARLLGALTFLIPAAGILRAMQLFGLRYWLDGVPPLMLMLGVILIYRAALRHKWITRFYLPGGIFSRSRFWITMIFFLLYIAAPLFFSTRTKPGFLVFIAGDLVVLSFAFLLYTTLRTCFPWRFAQERAIAPWVLWSALFAACLFTALNIFPHWAFLESANRYYALPLVLCGLLFHTVLFTFLLLSGRRLHVQFITLLLLCGLVLTSRVSNPLHQVKPVDSEIGVRHYDSLHVYARRWLMEHEKAMEASDGLHPYPVYFVNAHGGGIRAAAWTSLIMGTLDSVVRSRNYTEGLQDHVFAYSGASGGTIGASLLCANRSGQFERGAIDTLGIVRWHRLFSNDYLAPVALLLLGRDALQSSFGLHVARDRAALQDSVWEYHAGHNGIPYNKPMSHYWYGSHTQPLLFANTYHVETGFKAIAAPVLLADSSFPGTVFINRLIPDSTELKLSTAAFLSARFPIISPTAKFSDLAHFMDGGLKENSGAETLREVMAVFEQVRLELAATHPALLKLHYVVLDLPNSFPAEQKDRRANNPLELTAVFTALLNNKEGNTGKAVWVNQYIHFPFTYSYHSLRPARLCEEFAPALPLGWQISDEALDRMQSNLVKKQWKAVEEILEPFVKK